MEVRHLKNKTAADVALFLIDFNLLRITVQDFYAFLLVCVKFFIGFFYGESSSVTKIQQYLESKQKRRRKKLFNSYVT